MFRSVILGITLVVGLATSALASSLTDTYSSFWVFGDSLSDPGNLFAATGGTQPASPPYYNGRFSNGPVWAESLTGGFLTAGKAAGNFAFGGATAVANADGIPDLLDQTAIYAGTGATLAGPRPLASVFMGANDLLNAVGTYAGQSDAIQQIGAAAVAAANAVGAGVNSLAFQGIRDFAVWNLPDIGQTPALALLSPSGVGALGSFATAVFNAQLDIVIAGLGASGLNVTKIDTNQLFADVRADPAAFGLTDTVLPCLFPTAQAAAAFGQPQLCDPATADTRLFFDTVHPNSVAHQAMGANFAATIAPVPLPASALVMLAALAMLIALRRAGRATLA